jgi:hypothetical protein
MLYLLTFGLGVIFGAGVVLCRSRNAVVVFALLCAAGISLVIVAPACFVAIGCTKAFRRFRKRAAPG